MKFFGWVLFIGGNLLLYLTLASMNLRTDPTNWMVANIIAGAIFITAPSRKKEKSNNDG
jgi:hypothetical protein